MVTNRDALTEGSEERCECKPPSQLARNFSAWKGPEGRLGQPLILQTVGGECRAGYTFFLKDPAVEKGRKPVLIWIRLAMKPRLLEPHCPYLNRSVFICRLGVNAGDWKRSKP